MADTNSYSSENLFVASEWVHERQYTVQTMSQVMAAFWERFNKAPPWRATLLDWEKWAFTLGSVKDMLGSGKKTTRLEMCSGCRFHWTFPTEVDTDTIIGAWCAMSIMQDHMKKDLNVRPYHPTFMNELLDGNMDRRYESCRALLDTFSNAVFHLEVLFSDKCAIYLNARTEMWCSGQKRIPISRRSWNIIHLMW